MKYHALEALTKNIVLIDGISRSGKLLTGALYHHLKIQNI